MASTLPWPPLQTPLIEDARSGLITRVWFQWFLSVITRVQSAAFALVRQSLSAQAASIAPTALVPAAAAGLYRIGWYARITQAATTSSSLTISILGTDGGIVVTQSGAAITGNTTDTVQSGSVLLKVDGSTPIQYSTTYASVGATAMQYGIDLVLEQL